MGHCVKIPEAANFHQIAVSKMLKAEICGMYGVEMGLLRETGKKRRSTRSCECVDDEVEGSLMVS